MPPKKKLNAFMVFTLDWKEKYGKTMSLQQATAKCGEIWANMSPQERGPYKERAKDDKIASKNTREKLTCTGVPVAHVEKEKIEQEHKVRSMKKSIEKMVQDSLKRNELETKRYYFVMVNFFTKTLQGGVYLPAEISLSEFSLKDGVINKFHSFVNPGINIYGHTYEAQQHADDTHQLPLPPNAMGEANLGKLYAEVLKFLPTNANGDYPPVFTHSKVMPIVESTLNFIRSDTGARDIELDIYSIQYLFYVLKEAACEVGENPKPSSSYVTDAYFNRDIFEYITGIACAYHEERDKSNYCTLSCVVRWGYYFAEYILNDLAIKPIPGRHLPINIKSETDTQPQGHSSKFSDTESFVSMASESTHVTKALSEHKVYYDDHKSNISTRHAMFTKDDFPDLIGRGKKKARTTTSNDLSSLLNKDDESDVNHWASRSRQVPPQPDESQFRIDVSTAGNDLTDLNTDTDDASSVTSFGRGRLFMGNFGRGKPFGK